MPTLLRCRLVDGGINNFTALHLGRSIHYPCQGLYHVWVDIAVVSLCIGFVVPQADWDRHWKLLAKGKSNRGCPILDPPGFGLSAVASESQGTIPEFALSSKASWAGNFRDLNAAVSSMATLSTGGRISVEVVDEEILRLRASWRSDKMGDLSADLVQLLSEELLESLDLFDRCQLERVVATCTRCRSLSEAGRLLFHNSRSRKSSPNDADRLRKYRLGSASIGMSSLANEGEAEAME
jgi:hypothetical protein